MDSSPRFARCGRPLLLLAGLVLLASLAGCETEPEGPDPTDCPEDSVLTWDNFGGPHLLTWCAPCHSSALPQDERQDATEGVNLATYEEFSDHQSGVYQWATGESAAMPPSGGPTDEEKAMLAANAALL